jgi:acyl-coenzyme A thioesterase PaaI-like protein
MNNAFVPAAPAERHIPFLAWLGARLERVADGEAVVVVDLVREAA